jgi:hypothetical protein
VSKLNWYGDDARIHIDGLTADGLRAAVLQMSAEAKINATTNGQVDTGFMRNSIYTIFPDGQSSYGDILTSGRYTNRQGDVVERVAAPEGDLPDGAGVTAVLAVAAEYALYQEIAQPFIWPAIDAVRDQIGRLMTGRGS